MSTLSTTRRPSALRPARPGVPWKTVLTLAVAMSCAASFWLVSLQGAIGVPERNRTPFATSLLLSVVVLPVLALGVLGTLTLAMRWFGPVLRGPRSVLIAGLLVVAVGTLIGLGAIVASSTYDYSQQLNQIQTAHGMVPCTGSCVPREQHDILVLHVRGVLLVGRWLLLTNLVLVAWIVAMWGGRIKLITSSTTAPDDEAADQETLPAGGLSDDVRLLLVGALGGAAVIHAAVIREHLSEWPAAGLFFVALTVAEIVVAGLVLGRLGGRTALLAATALSVVPLAVWLWSRTLGLPFGPEAGIPEAVAVPDVLACFLEIGAALAALALLTPRRLVRPPLSAHAKGLAVLALVAITTIGFAATGPAWFDAFGVAASQTGMEMPQ